MKGLSDILPATDCPSDSDESGPDGEISRPVAVELMLRLQGMARAMLAGLPPRAEHLFGDTSNRQRYLETVGRPKGIRPSELEDWSEKMDEVCRKLEAERERVEQQYRELKVERRKIKTQREKLEAERQRLEAERQKTE